MNRPMLTIGRLARAAGVGIETIRHYQRLGLLPVPPASAGAYRSYPAALVDRIRFIKRAQELGFTLAEAGELLQLEDGRRREAVRRIATRRLAQIRDRLEGLQRMERALDRLLGECERASGSRACPIIAALLG